MELTVLVQPRDGSGFRAWCEQPVAASAEGATRDEALTRLRAELLARTHNAEVVRMTIPIGEVDPHGTLGDEQGNAPEAIAAWVAAFDAIPALQMTPAEEETWKAARLRQKQADAAAFDRLLTSLPGAAE